MNLRGNSIGTDDDDDDDGRRRRTTTTHLNLFIVLNHCCTSTMDIVLYNMSPQRSSKIPLKNYLGNMILVKLELWELVIV